MAPTEPPRPAVDAFVGLGANLGDAQATLGWAFEALGRLPATQLRASSSLYRTAPQDCAPGTPDFLNAVAHLVTGLSAPELLDQLLALEARAGRQRPYRHAPRTLDLDLLLYGEGSIHSPALTVPHPRMRQRGFVLLPLAELAPQRVDAADLRAAAGQGVQRV